MSKTLSLLVRNGATKNSRARSHVTVTPPSAERKNCGAPNVSRAGTRLVQFCYFWFLFLIFGTILQELSDQEKEYRAEFVQYFVPSSCEPNYVQYSSTIQQCRPPAQHLLVGLCLFGWLIFYNGHIKFEIECFYQHKYYRLTGNDSFQQSANCQNLVLVFFENSLSQLPLSSVSQSAPQHHHKVHPPIVHCTHA